MIHNTHSLHLTDKKKHSTGLQNESMNVKYQHKCFYAYSTKAPNMAQMMSSIYISNKIVQINKVRYPS